MKCAFQFDCVLSRIFIFLFVADQVSGSSHRLPSGDILFSKTLEDISYNDSLSLCWDDKAYLLELPSQEIKDEAMDYIRKTWSPDVHGLSHHVWLGTIKESTFDYKWNASGTCLDRRITRFDPLRLMCRKCCCRLKLLSWGTVYGVDCSDGEETGKVICYKRSVSDLSSSVEQLEKDFYHIIDSPLNEVLSKYKTMKTMVFVNQLITEDAIMRITDDITRMNEELTDMESKATRRQRESENLKQDIASLKWANTVQITLFSICIFVMFVILAFNINMIIVFSDTS